MCVLILVYIDCKSVAKYLGYRVVFVGIYFFLYQWDRVQTCSLSTVIPVAVLSVFCYWTFSTVNSEFVLCVK